MLRNIFFILLFFTLNVFSQPGKYAHIARTLVPEPVPVVVEEPDYQAWITVSVDTTLFIELPRCVFRWFPPECGDTYQWDGSRYCHAECVDGILHGKATYWNDEGRKSREETYSKGYRLNEKTYDHMGRIQSLYRYDKNGDFHGVCSDYTYAEYEDESNVVTSTTYDHGIKHGSEKEFTDGKLTGDRKYHLDTLLESKEIYPDNLGYLVEKFGPGEINLERKEYGPTGNLTMHELQIDGPDTGFYKTWNSDGVLLTDGKTIRGKRIGIWIYPDCLREGEMNIMDYADGSTWTSTNYKNSKPWLQSIHNGGGYEINRGWYENGDTSFVRLWTDSMRTRTLKAWDESGFMTNNYTMTGSTNGSEIIFKGYGWYTHDDTLYVVTAEEQPERWMPIERWVIYKGDTIRQDYLINNVGPTYGKSAIILSNHFRRDVSTGEWLRDGLWKNYTNNNLVSVVPYFLGVRTGWAEYYRSVGDDSFIHEEGRYDNGRQGEWTRTTTNGKWVYTYTNSILNGQHRYYNSGGILIHELFYVDGKMNGKHRQFYEDGTLKTEGPYMNDQPHGWWKYYNEKGQLILEGEYENGERIGAWFEYTHSIDKEPKRSKLKYA